MAVPVAQLTLLPALQPPTTPLVYPPVRFAEPPTIAALKTASTAVWHSAPPLREQGQTQGTGSARATGGISPMHGAVRGIGGTRKTRSSEPAKERIELRT